MSVVKTCEFVVTNLSTEEREQTRTPLLMTKKQAIKYLRRVLPLSELEILQMQNGGCNRVDPETGEVFRVSLIEVAADPNQRVRLEPNKEGEYSPRIVEGKKP